MSVLPKIKLWKPVLTFLLFGVLAWWLLNTFTTGNPMWFLPIQPSYVPNRIIVRNFGEEITLRPGDLVFQSVADGVDQSLSNFNNRALIDIGLGEATLQDYQTDALVVEVYYPTTIRFNLPIRMNKINQLLFPVVGRHADTNYVFMGYNGNWLVGALQVSTAQPLQDALREAGYWQDSE